MKKTNGFSPLLYAAFVLLIGGAANGDDIDQLLLRLRADYLTSSSSGADEYLANQQVDGSWADIDYTDKSRTDWKPVNHLRRLRRMAVAYCSESNPHHDSTYMREGVSKGLDYWYAAKPLSDNWWYNDIGQQLELGPLLIIMKEDLASAQLETGCLYLNNPRATGQNLVWYATQTVQRGCLEHSLADINRGLDAIKGEVRITTEEGIQPDFSFHQHGPQLYNGGYGKRFVADVSYWIDMSRGLSFAFSEERISVFSDFILDGTQWMVRRGYLDMACQGREISRPNSGNSHSFSSALSRMARSKTVNAALFSAFFDHIAGSNDANLVGNKYFWRADYLAHRRPQYHTSVKMCSSRTTGTEYMNQENKKAYYLPFGATTVMCTGDEYHNIYPTWDWARVPGVTCPYKNPPPQMETYIKGRSGFVGGVSNGVYGVAGMDLDWDGVTGRKAWFYFDSEFVALGAGVSCSTGEDVITSINQCHLRGEISFGNAYGTGKVVAKGTHTLQSPKWVYHDRVGYIFPQHVDIATKNDAQSGSWKSINDTYSSDTIYTDVFTLWIDHGADPSNATYEYIVVPGVDKSSISAYVRDFPVRILSNTTEIQAVRNKTTGLCGIVFYKEGTVEIREGFTFQVDSPCMALIDESGMDLRISISNPENQAIVVEANVIKDNRLPQRLAFNLPAGGEAGRSITLECPPGTILE